MKKITTSIAILLLLAGTFFSCNNEKEEYFDEPIDVPFTIFSKSDRSNLLFLESLTGTSCEWVRLTSSQPDGVVIINSDEELQNFLICRIDNHFPVIDFSKYTLLLARGITSGHAALVHFIDLQQLSSRNYVMDVRRSVGGLAMVSYWHAAIIIEKLDKNARVRLNVTFY